MSLGCVEAEVDKYESTVIRTFNAEYFLMLKLPPLTTSSIGLFCSAAINPNVEKTIKPQSIEVNGLTMPRIIEALK